MAAQQQATLASDSVFLLRAGSIGLLQAKLAKLAERKGSSEAVLEFGKRMTADYSKANKEIAAAAKQAAYPAPVLLREHKQIAERFNGMGRSSFDKLYMVEVMKQHDEAVRLFREESESGKVGSLKQLASKYATRPAAAGDARGGNGQLGRGRGRVAQTGKSGVERQVGSPEAGLPLLGSPALSRPMRCSRRAPNRNWLARLRN